MHFQPAVFQQYFMDSDRFEHGSSEVLTQTILNSETHFIIVEYDGEECPSIESISTFVCVGVKPFK